LCFSYFCFFVERELVREKWREEEDREKERLGLGFEEMAPIFYQIRESSSLFYGFQDICYKQKKQKYQVIVLKIKSNHTI